MRWLWSPHPLGNGIVLFLTASSQNLQANTTALFARHQRALSHPCLWDSTPLYATGAHRASTSCVSFVSIELHMLACISRQSARVIASRAKPEQKWLRIHETHEDISEIVRMFLEQAMLRCRLCMTSGRVPRNKKSIHRKMKTSFESMALCHHQATTRLRQHGHTHSHAVSYTHLTLPTKA